MGRPAAQRGHGLARLDGARPQATVAYEVMKSEEDGTTGNDLQLAPIPRKRSAQRREARRIEAFHPQRTCAACSALLPTCLERAVVRVPLSTKKRSLDQRLRFSDAQSSLGRVQ